MWCDALNRLTQVIQQDEKGGHSTFHHHKPECPPFSPLDIDHDGSITNLDEQALIAYLDQGNGY